MGPLVKMGEIATGWDFVIAFVIGIFFGLVMEQAGFSSSKKITGWIYGYDFTVIKVFFTAAVVAMVGIVVMQYIGWINFDELFVNPLFLWSEVVGSVIMGAGFAIGGFCPGTSVAAAGIGKKDAMVFILGIMIGVLIFSEGYPLWKGLYLGSPYGRLLITDLLGISKGVWAFIFIIVALASFWGTSIIRKKYAHKELEYNN
jgi:hypothetical protein